jgi:hypothetical protein
LREALLLAETAQVLCDPLAINMRNNISHGISESVGRVGAALLLQVACYLSLMRRQ